MGGWGCAIPWLYTLVILEIFEVICIQNFVCKSELSFSNIFSKTTMKIACFHDFLRKNQFLTLFYTQNANFSISEGVLTLWRHSDVVHKIMLLIYSNQIKFKFRYQWKEDIHCFTIVVNFGTFHIDNQMGVATAPSSENM